MLREILELLATDPLLAADAIDRYADQLKERAREIRELVERGRTAQADAPGGMGDRVKMAVVGPDGGVKQTVDTDTTR